MITTDFQHLQLPKTPNYYLVCPANYCNVTPQRISPTYHVSIKVLIPAWNAMLYKQPRVKLLAHDRTLNQYDYIQRSRVFRFPDFITVRFISESEQTSTIAIYSRAKYGYTDFKVNQKRVEKWLSELGDETAKKN